MALPMKISAKSFALVLCVGVSVAAFLAAVPTAIDWYKNPAGIFRSESGINMEIVLETWFSWFWPAAVFTIPAVLALYLWSSHRRAASAT